MPTTDTTLRQQCIEGLYADHHGWLKAWLRRRLGDSFAAADLAHDTFLRLLGRTEALAVEEPRAFLTTVATRVLANHWRREQLERAYLETLRHLPQALALAPSPEERALLLEALCEIDALLDGLPVPAKRAFLFSQLDGLTQAQIAERLGVTERTVRRYLTQAAETCFFADVLGRARA
ncbi:sigma-70 family RNA polymerase sigma factor [Acidovorax sp. YS12]|nr:sigma-70 family RNA polymerase sigma factor [Acidovorax sp. YS12]